jgi:hypothetical protein
MHNTPLPKLTLIALKRQMALAIKPLALLRQGAQPRLLLPLSLKQHTLLLQLLRHRIDIHAQIIPQELADLGVLVVAHERGGALGVGSVDVDVCTAVAVGGPAGLAAAGERVGEAVLRFFRAVDESVDFGVGVVFDAEAGGEGGFDMGDLVVAGGRVGEEILVGEGKVFSGVGGVGEYGGEPAVFGVGFVEFWGG